MAGSECTVVRRFVCGVALLGVLAGAVAAEAESGANVRQFADGFSSADYLQAQDAWPPLHPQALDDVRAVPDSSGVDALLAELGEQLFFDPGLSGDGSVSCGSCHRPEQHFADSDKLSPGVEGRLGKRTTPMLRLVEHWDVLFWDARVDSLEALVEQPLTAAHEMNNSTEAAVEYVRGQPRYVEQFAAVAFGDGGSGHVAEANNTDSEDVSWWHIARAIAEFMRSIEAPERPFDHFMRAVAASDYAAAAEVFTAEEIEGLHLFRGKAGCVQCHSGVLLSDQRLHNIGLTYYGRRHEDLGHYLISGEASDVGKFRTPSLRYLGERSHFMHNGLFNDLLGIIRMYSHGGARPRPRGEQVDDPLFPVTSELLQQFPLTPDEEQALLAFLQTL
ncbi:cytochrome-c peroxidase [Aliidiomarina sedimenti]|uniref:Cytochrome-c peroxidase n=1 Tax=Aliidiomarina sedimenti TaxID=1933879 RepID=A0ABY0BZA4_9GAMM|nr:cytochrome-c peroxidase [Aliidiomarina sedimenti]